MIGCGPISCQILCGTPASAEVLCMKFIKTMIEVANFDNSIQVEGLTTPCCPNFAIYKKNRRWQLIYTPLGCGVGVMKGERFAKQVLVELSQARRVYNHPSYEDFVNLHVEIERARHRARYPLSQREFEFEPYISPVYPGLVSSLALQRQEAMFREWSRLHAIGYNA